MALCPTGDKPLPEMSRAFVFMCAQFQMCLVYILSFLWCTLVLDIQCMHKRQWRYLNLNLTDENDLNSTIALQNEHGTVRWWINCRQIGEQVRGSTWIVKKLLESESMLLSVDISKILLISLNVCISITCTKLSTYCLLDHENSVLMKLLKRWTISIKMILTISSKSPQHSTVLVAQPWWRHQMETFSALLAICAGNSPVPGEFPAQMPVKRSFDVFFDLRLNKRLSKQSWGWWFETLSRPLWRHCNDQYNLTHWGLVAHTCQWTVSVASHYPNQYWFLVN